MAADGFHTKVVRRRERTSRGTQGFFACLYLEGLATGEFELGFRELVGETSALSPTTIVRLKERWADDFATRKKPGLETHQYA